MGFLNDIIQRTGDYIASLKVGGTTNATAGQLHVGTPSAATVAAVTGTGGIIGANATAPVQLALENSATSSSTAGAVASLYTNDGAAMASGDRLGGFLFGGAKDASSLANAAGVFSFAAEAWSGSTNGSDLRFETAAIGETSRTERIRIAGTGAVAVAAPGSVTTGNKFQVSTPVAADTAADTILAASASGKKPLVLQGATTGSANILDFYSGTQGGLRSWYNSAGSFITLNPVAFRYRSVTTTPYAVTGTADGIVSVNVASASVLNLPAANSLQSGTLYVIKDASGNALVNNITINRAGSDLIDGATSKVISTNYGSYSIYTDGASNWLIF